MALYAVKLAERVAGEGLVIVVGHQASQVKTVVEAHYACQPQPAARRGSARREIGLTASVKNPVSQAPQILLAEQRQQLGTGHAVMQARETLLRARSPAADRYVILNGDTPLLSEATVRALVQLHEADKATVTILTAVLDDPSGYGRVVRSGEGGALAHRGRVDETAEAHRGREVLKIVEHRDATAAESALREVNVGTYVVNGPFLFEALDALQPHNAQQEYYLTDIVKLAVDRGLRVSALPVPDAQEGLGINSRGQLAEAERVTRRQLCDYWMEQGVTLRDPATTWIDADVRIGQDTVVHPHVALEGRTVIGEDCEIRAHTRITDGVVGDRVVIQDCCVIEEARLEDEATVGPFARLRPGAVVRRSAKVGNFVEMKKAELGEGSKANHLSYLGDARIGKRVNIGAGTITCNYDGYHKFETVIEDDVFVGSDTQFIAPVTVGRGAVIGAGSSITENVPADALAIARSRQVTQPTWAARRRALLASEGGHQASGEERASGRSQVRGTRQEASSNSHAAKPRDPRPASRASRNTRAKKR